MKLTPVDNDPFAQGVNLVPVEGDPFASADPGIKGRAVQASGGIYKGLANTLGFFTGDLANNAANLVRAGVGTVANMAGRPDLAPAIVPANEAPLTGASIQDWLKQHGLIGPDPTDRLGRYIDYGGQMVGSTILPAGATLSAARVMPMTGPTVAVPTIGQQMVQAAQQNPAAFAASQLRGAVTAGVGGQTAREMYPGNPLAEMVGQLTPDALIYGVPAAVRGMARGNNADQMQRNIQSFEDAGVSPSVGQASENTFLQGTENALANTPGGSSVMRNAARKAADDLQQSVESAASKYGKPVSPTQAGLTIERGITAPGGFIDRFQTRAGSLYDNLDNFISSDAPIAVKNTASALDDLTALTPGAKNLSAQLVNPKLKAISEAFSQDIEGTNTLPWEAVKSVRTKVGELLNSKELLADAPRAQLKHLYSALSKDMESAARTAGPEAYNAFSRANSYWKAGRERIDNALDTIVSRASPEDIYRLAVRGKEGASMIWPLRRSLTPNQWDVVAGTTLNRLGMAKASMQNAEGTQFSVETFLTNWHNLSPQARDALFAGTRYQGLQKDLNAIVNSASLIRNASRVGMNPSGTAGQAANIAALSTAFGGLAGGIAAGNVPMALGTAGLVAAMAGMNAGASKLMTSPSFVRWLARSTTIPTQNLPGYIARLPSALKDESPEVKKAATVYLNQLHGDTNQ